MMSSDSCSSRSGCQKTRNPKTDTRKPKHETRNPKPETWNQIPETRDKRVMFMMSSDSCSSRFGFRVSSFGYLVSGFGPRVSGIGFRISGVGFQASSLGFRASGFGLRVSVFGFRVSCLRPRVSGFDFQVQHRRLQDAGLSQAALLRTTILRKTRHPHCQAIQGYFAHKKTPTPQGLPAWHFRPIADHLPVTLSVGP